MAPLLDIVARNDVTWIDAMKMDIDGFAPKALGPFFDAAPDALLPRRIVPEMIFVTQEAPLFLKTMEQRGYRPVGPTRSNGLFERDRSGVDAAAQS